MSPKTIISTVLIAFLAISVAYLAVDELRSHRSRNTVSAEGNVAATDSSSIASGPSTAARTRDSQSQGPEVASSREDRAPGKAPLALQEETTPGSPASRPPAATRDTTTKVIAYYFHGTQRCPTCRKLEAYSLESIEKKFAAELRQGLLEWQVVNVDEPENEHFVDDYGLYTRSLVVVRVDGGHQVEWKNLERIWELVDDREAFFDYVQQETATYLRKTE